MKARLVNNNYIVIDKVSLLRPKLLESFAHVVDVRISQ